MRKSVKWCEFGGTQCPTCKTLLTEIKYDREFDNLVSIINQENTENYEYLPSKAGITIHNNYDWFDKRGPGVVISKINDNYECYKGGLREKDIIIFINNIPCINH